MEQTTAQSSSKTAATMPLALWGLLALVALAGGCGGINRAVTKHFYLERDFKEVASQVWLQRAGFNLDNRDLERERYWGPAIAGKVEVYYSKGLAADAELLAGETAVIIERTEKRLGLEFTYRLRLYLTRVDVLPHRVRQRITADYDERVFVAPVFLENGSSVDEGGAWPSPANPYVFVHELTEATLLDQDRKTPVLPDLVWGPIVFSYGTRWFRDGLANYAGFVATEIARERFGRGQYDHRLSWGVFHSSPFSSLAKTGKDLFRWHEASPARADNRHYSAALGLFLVIADRYGEEKIREIVEGIDALGYADGPALRRLVSDVIGTDVVDMAEAFSFPRLGIESTVVTPALALNLGLFPSTGFYVTKVVEGSAAQKAGVKAGDFILSATGAGERMPLEWQYSAFEVLPDGVLKLAVKRAGEDVELSLQLGQAELIVPPKARRDKNRNRDRAEGSFWSGAYSFQLR